MPTTTTTYALQKPTVGGDSDVWGGLINDNADKLDDILDGTLPITPAAGNDIDIVGTNAATNTVTTLLTLNSQSTGTPAAGIGSALAFAAETAAGNTEVGAVIEAVTTDVTSTSEDFDLVIKTMAGGATAAERLRVKSTGQLVVNGSEFTGAVDPENRIINGSFDFWQRGTSFTANGYTADRWEGFFSGGTVTTSRQSFALGDTLGSNSPTFFLRQTVSGQSLASHLATVVQKIESVRSYAGQTITILGWARRSSGSGNMVVEGYQLFGTGGSPSATVTGISPTTVSLTGSWAAFAVTMTVPSIAGKTLGSNNNDFFGINFWTSAGSDFNARANSLGIQTIGVDLWGVHIKLGTHTTTAVDLYKAPELGPELARCQRYCVVYGGEGSVEGAAIGSAANGTQANVLIDLPVRMRAVPATSLSGSWQLSDLVAAVAVTGSSQPANQSSSSKVVFQPTVASGLTTYRPYRLEAASSTASRITIDAEL